MRSRILLSFLLTALFVLFSGCGSVKNCPVCGTTQNDGYVNIDVIPVPEHNPTGEPGGPFNSFDISVVDSINHRMYVSDRIGLDVVVTDTVADTAIFAITGFNGVAGAGVVASKCDPSIPPLVSGEGNWVRFACRTGSFHIPGFGANGFFGGFPGAQCCAARANGVNPLSGPDGEQLTPDGKILITANGSSSVAVFDMTTMDLTTNPPTAPTLIADIPTGMSPDYDGQNGNSTAFFNNQVGIAGCVASANGRAFSDPSCGDLRADEMSYDPKDQIVMVANGDPGFPFVTLINVSEVVNHTGTATDALGGPHCLPAANALAYGPPDPTTGTSPVTGSINPPLCVMGQIYYDGAGGPGVGLNPGTTVDNVGAGAFPCPDPSNPQIQSGVSGQVAATHSATNPNPPILGSRDIPCHHGPVLTSSGAFCNQTAPGAGCAGAIAPAGLGGSAFNPNTGHFLQSNSNATADLTVGTIDEIDPRVGNPNGPIVVNSFVMPNCMPTSIVQGPGNNFLVGCGDHDGEAFPPNEYVIDGTSGAILATVTQVGGVDEVWYNPGDNRYYLAARDMPGGPVLGIIDAGTNLWLQSVTTGANSHSVSVDSGNNHVFVPLQAGPMCTTQSSNGCIGVWAQQ